MPTLHLRLPPLLGLLALACSSPGSLDSYRSSLEDGLRHLAADDPEAAVEDMERLITALPDETIEHALLRFHAESIAAQAHTAASLGRPFRNERTFTGSMSGGIGRHGSDPPAALRPSTTSHLVSAIYHANQAHARFERAARGSQGASTSAFLPDELAGLDVETAAARLQVLSTVAYARLGFREKVSAILAQSPDLVNLESCLASLDRFQIPASLRPWVCEMVFHHLRGVDQEAAFRFGVLAVEGADRFGHALPPDAIANIDEWILHGSHLRFVCPESQTPYLPGERRSPVSGIPHLDYVAVERPPDER